MFHGLPPVNDLFNEEVTNELNTSFQQIQEKIENMEVPDLKYKFPVSEASVYSTVPESYRIINRSILIGKELILDFDLLFTDDVTVPLATNLQIGKVAVNTGYKYFGTFCTDATNTNYKFLIDEDTLYISGTAESIQGVTFHKDITYHFYGDLIIAG